VAITGARRLEVLKDGPAAEIEAETSQPVAARRRGTPAAMSRLQADWSARSLPPSVASTILANVASENPAQPGRVRANVHANR